MKVTKEQAVNIFSWLQLLKGGQDGKFNEHLAFAVVKNNLQLQPIVQEFESIRKELITVFLEKNKLVESDLQKPEIVEELLKWFGGIEKLNDFLKTEIEIDFETISIEQYKGCVTDTNLFAQLSKYLIM